jgi:hypothetical protein
MSDSELAASKKAAAAAPHPSSRNGCLPTREHGLMPVSFEMNKKDKKKRTQNLPAGVNERDLELFTISQVT